MNAAFGPAIIEFQTAIDLMLSMSLFVEVATQLRPRLGRQVNWQSLDDAEKLLVQSFIKMEPTLALSEEGTTLRICAQFENFLRRIIRDAALEISLRKVKAEGLKPPLLAKNRHFAGMLLSKVLYSDGVTRDYDRLCREIGTCTPGSVVTLSGESLAESLENISPASIDLLFELFGHKLNWDKIATHAVFAAARKQEGTRELAKAIKERLSELHKLRNRLAHSGYGGVVLPEGSLQQTGDFLKRLAEAVTGQLSSVL